MNPEPSSLLSQHPGALPPPLLDPKVDAVRPKRLSTLRLLSLLGTLTLAMAALHFFPPGKAGFYPPCLFHRVTGLNCPGCGATRAVYALLHGEISLAWRHNALLVLLAPFTIPFLGAAAWKWVHCRPLPSLPGHPWSIYALLTALALFGVARNL